MALLRYIDKLNQVLTEEDKEFFMKMDKNRFPEYHHIFGKLIRRKCYFWKEGTDDFQKDVNKLVETGYTPQALTALKEKRLAPDMSRMSASLNHPDNASHVLMDIYQDYCNFAIQRERLQEMGL